MREGSLLWVAVQRGRCVWGQTRLHNARTLTILRSTVHFCGSVITWSVTLAVAAALGAAAYYYLHLGDEIRRRVEKKLAAHYPQLKVHVAAARFLEGEGIEIRGLTISDPEGRDPRPLLEIEELFVVTAAGLTDLAQNRVHATRVILRRPLVRAVKTPEGTWNLGRLLPLPPSSVGCTHAVIRNGSLEILDASRNAARPLVLREINVDVRQNEASRRGAGSEPPLVATGTMAGDLVQKLELEASLYPDEGAWRVQAGVTGLAVRPGLLAALPLALPAGAEAVRGLRAQANLTVEVSGGPAGPSAIHLEGVLARGQFTDPRLPFPLSDVTAQFEFDNGRLSVHRLTARHGQTTVHLTSQQESLASGDMLLQLKVRRLPLSPELASLWSEEAGVLWDKFQPAGEADVDCWLRYADGGWQPDLAVQLADASLSYYRFPYRLHDVAGTLTSTPRGLNMNLQGAAQTGAVRIAGELEGLREDSLGWVAVHGTNVPIDDALMAALPDGAQRFARSLHPSGLMDFSWMIERANRGQADPDSRLKLAFRQGAVESERFPYPLREITGDVEAHNGRWWFRNLRGSNDAAVVQCSGTMAPADDGPLVNLRFDALGIAFDRELRGALKPDVQRAWDQLRPRGHTDAVAEVAYDAGRSDMDLKLWLRPSGDTASIEPVAFPYLFDKVRGTIAWHDGTLALDNLRAEHGQTQIVASGAAEMAADGGWTLSFDRFAADRIEADRDLMLALPAGVRGAVGQLNPRGGLNVQGGFRIAKGPQADDPPTSSWDLTFNMHGGELDCGVPLQDIFGELRLAGQYDGARFQSRGELAVDALSYGELQFTDVLGPLWIDSERALAGAWAEPQQQDDPRRRPRRISAKIYDGTLVLDAGVAFDQRPRYSLQASLAGADLDRYATESLPGEQDVKGSLSGNLVLQGTAPGTKLLVGRGNVQLQEADIGELPVMIQLLKVLRARQPNNSAFTQANVDFRIEGEHVLFDRFDLQGDAISMYGKGEMDFERQLNLRFHTQLGSQRLPLPVLQQFVGEASGQILQARVTGPLGNPQIASEVFPGVGEMLQQLQEDLARPPTEALSLHPRRWLFAPRTSPSYGRR